MENMFYMKCHAQWIRKTIRANPEVLQYGRKKNHILGVCLCCRLLQSDGIDKGSASIAAQNSLLERKKRKFMLTPAGEYFYKKSLVRTADYERMCWEAGRLAKDGKKGVPLFGNRRAGVYAGGRGKKGGMLWFS